MLDRQDRKKLYKHRKANGFLGKNNNEWDWTKWNQWFRTQSESLQQVMYEEMLKDKGEEKMIMTGQFNAIPKDMWYISDQLDCCPPTASAPCKTGPCSPTCEMTWPDHSKCAAIQSPCTPLAWKVPAKKQEEEQKMSYNQIDVRVAPTNSAQSEIATQRKFLSDILFDLYWSKRNSSDLRRAFGLMDDDAPKTIKERKARMAAGKFTIDFDYDDDDFEEDEDHYGLGRGHIRWRDPAVKEDQAGLAAVQKLIDAENTKTQRIIQIKDADTGLAAIEAFEAKTFH